MSLRRTVRRVLLSRWIATAALLVATSVARAQPTPPADYEVVEVSTGRVELRVNATGSLRPRDRVVVPAPISGKVEWVIEEGTAVKAGTEIARVDCTEYLENLAQQKLELSVVEAELRRAKLEAQLVSERLTFEVRKAELELERATLAHADLGAPTDTERALSQLVVDQTKFAMEAAEREWQRLKKLGESGIESSRTVALSRLKYERARADHLKAAAAHALLLKGDPQEDIDVAFQEMQRATVTLELARERLKGEVAYQATQVEVAQVSVDRVKALVDLQQERVDRSRVVAPVDGVVYYPRYWGMPLREGDPVWQSNRFVDLAASSAMTIESTVSQADWARVKPDQDVEVRLVAYPGSLYHGKVKQVGVLARDRSLILRENPANVMSFPVLVDVVEQSPELRSSYTAKISIITDRLEEALAVPRGAVVSRRDEVASGQVRSDSGHAVWVLEGEVPVLRTVTLGPSDAVNAVVRSGLEIGERVLVPRSDRPDRSGLEGQ